MTELDAHMQGEGKCDAQEPCASPVLVSVSLHVLPAVQATPAVVTAQPGGCCISDTAHAPDHISNVVSSSSVDAAVDRMLDALTTEVAAESARAHVHLDARDSVTSNAGRAVEDMLSAIYQDVLATVSTGRSMSSAMAAEPVASAPRRSQQGVAAAVSLRLVARERIAVTTQLAQLEVSNSAASMPDAESAGMDAVAANDCAASTSSSESLDSAEANAVEAALESLVLAAAHSRSTVDSADDVQGSTYSSVHANRGNECAAHSRASASAPISSLPDPILSTAHSSGADGNADVSRRGTGQASESGACGIVMSQLSLEVDSVLNALLADLTGAGMH
jgi:hypothetical protein